MRWSHSFRLDLRAVVRDLISEAPGVAKLAGWILAGGLAARLEAERVALLVLGWFRPRRQRAREEFGRLAGDATDTILVTAAGALSRAELLRLTAELAAAKPGAAPAAIARTPKEAEELRRSVPGVEIYHMLEAWTDPAIDRAFHERVAALLRQTRDYRLTREPRGKVPKTSQTDSAGPLDFLDLLFPELHAHCISALRLSYAIGRAVESGNRLVILPFRLDRWDIGWASAFVRLQLKRSVQMKTVHGAYGSTSVRDSDLRLEEALYSFAREAYDRLELFERDEAIPEEEARPSKPRPPLLLIISDALPNSIYWNSLFNFYSAAARRSVLLRLLTSRVESYSFLRRRGKPVARARASVGRTATADFALGMKRLLLKLLDFQEDISPADEGDPSRLLVQSMIAHFAAIEVIDRVAYARFRAASDLRRMLLAQNVREIVCLPHWGTHAWLAMTVGSRLGVEIASTPAVTVSANPASIIGWETCTLIGCYGSQCVEAFRSLGFSKDKLVTVGNLSLDHLLGSGRPELPASTPSPAGVFLAGRRHVLFASSGVLADEADFIRALLDALGERGPGIRLVIRPHPSVGAEAYLAMLRRSDRRRCIVTARGHVHAVISAADVVITDYSTVGAEAIFLGKPLVTINSTGRPFPANDYASIGVAAPVCSAAEIGEVTLRLLDEGPFWPDFERRKAAFIAAYNAGNDGRASERLLDALLARRSCVSVGPKTIEAAAQ